MVQAIKTRFNTHETLLIIFKPHKNSLIKPFTCIQNITEVGLGCIGDGEGYSNTFNTLKNLLLPSNPTRIYPTELFPHT